MNANRGSTHRTTRSFRGIIHSEKARARRPMTKGIDFQIHKTRPQARWRHRSASTTSQRLWRYEFKRQPCRPKARKEIKNNRLPCMSRKSRGRREVHVPCTSAARFGPTHSRYGYIPCDQAPITHEFGLVLRCIAAALHTSLSRTHTRSGRTRCFLIG